MVDRSNRNRLPERPLPPPTAWPVPSEPVEGQDTGLAARAQYVAARVGLGVASRLPEFLLRPLLIVLARIGTVVDRRHTRAAEEFLELALGPLSDAERSRRVRGAYEHLFRVAIESECFVREIPLERTFEHFEFDFCEQAWQDLESGSGMILITPHIGNWEVASIAVSRLGWQPVYAVAKPAKNSFVSRHMQSSREQRGIRLLPRRGAMQAAPKVLEAGGTFGMLLDQRARTRPVMAPFFGRMARCDRSVGVLVKRLAKPLLFVACYRVSSSPMRFRMEIRRVVQPADLRGLSSEAISTLINAEFERMIRVAPEQYFWLHDRFRDTPFEAAHDAAADDAADAAADRDPDLPDPPDLPTAPAVDA